MENPFKIYEPGNSYELQDYEIVKGKKRPVQDQTTFVQFAAPERDELPARKGVMMQDVIAMQINYLQTRNGENAELDERETALINHLTAALEVYQPQPTDKQDKSKRK